MGMGSTPSFDAPASAAAPAEEKYAVSHASRTEGLRAAPSDACLKRNVPRPEALMTDYGPMPAAPEPLPGVPAQAPSTVRNAVLLMYIRAGLGALGIIVVVATKNSLRNAIRDQHPEYTADKLDRLANNAVTAGIIIGIVFLVLYVLLAIQVARGRNWARIVTWVISALGVIGLLGVLGESSAASKILGVVSGLLAIAIIILLAMAPSNQYFAAGPWR
jgi:hypothetical protein